ncbi:MAG: hypothetical protein WC325_01725 [Candidatus Bathyarchaeia archaeon]
MAVSGPMNLNQLAEKVERNKTGLINNLRLLKKSNLIEKHKLSKNEIVYAATQTGLRVLTVLGQITEDSDKVQTTQL